MAADRKEHTVLEPNGAEGAWVRGRFRSRQVRGHGATLCLTMVALMMRSVFDRPVCALPVLRVHTIRRRRLFFVRRRVGMHATWMIKQRKERGKKGRSMRGYCIEREAPSNHLVRMYAFHTVLDGCARMVAMSRRERMVAHCFTDAPILLAVMIRRRTFF